MKTVILSGGSGFLGSAMAERWRSLGCEVRTTGTVRFGKDLPPALFAGADLFVHAAHDFTPGSEQRTIEATQQWFQAARAAGVVRQVFLSSYSAHPAAVSRYGSAKFVLEQFFLENSGIVVRPGLVAGPGGMFARMTRSLLRWRLAPLVGADVRDVAVIALDDLAGALHQIAERANPGSAWNLLAPDLLTPREFAHNVWRARNVRGIVCPIPAGAALFVLQAVRADAVLDSLRGRLSPPMPPYQSDIAQWIDVPQTAERAIHSAVREL